jgi:uncharacterized DUF497 family protein
MKKSFHLYTWDPEKSKKNKKKHGFSFEEIIDVVDNLNLSESGISIISAREASPREKKAYYEYEEKRR